MLGVLAGALLDQTGVAPGALDLLLQRLQRRLHLVAMALGLGDLRVAALLRGEKDRQEEPEPQVDQGTR